MSYDLAKEIAKGALRIEWRDTETAARRVAEYAADRIEELERKLAKCEALMHAGLAEYQRRLVRVIEASIAVRSAQKTYFKDRSKDNLIASKQAETILDKVLAELKGETDE